MIELVGSGGGTSQGDFKGGQGGTVKTEERGSSSRHVKRWTGILGASDYSKWCGMGLVLISISDSGGRTLVLSRCT